MTPPEHPVERATHSLVGMTLNMRQRDEAGSLARLRSAVSPLTEARAFSLTEFALADVRDPTIKQGLRRAAGITATHNTVPQYRQDGNRLPIGSSLRFIHTRAQDFSPGDTTKGRVRTSAFLQQVSALPLMDLESSARTLNLLIGRAAGHGIEVDFFDLARTLAWWGDGIAPTSVRTRYRVVECFFGA